MTIHEAPRPGVLLWQGLYCGAMTLLYVAVFVGGVAMMVLRHELADAAVPVKELGGAAVAQRHLRRR